MSVSQDQASLAENAKPGEFVLQTLFLELCTITERKIEQVLAEPLVSKTTYFYDYTPYSYATRWA